ncbi:MAG: hypothetical protein ACREUU_12355 [Gammaproteobacteria bacterium]
MRNLSVKSIVFATLAVALIVGGMPGSAEAGVCKKVGKKDGCVNAKDVRDNNLTAADQLDEAGADFIEQDDVALTGATQVIASVQVTAPGSGVVIANASGWFDMGPTANAVVCALSQDANLPAAFFPLLVEDHAADPGQADDDEAFALTRGFQVNAGTITVNLVCLGGNTASVADVALTAMYFPTRY